MSDRLFTMEYADDHLYNLFSNGSILAPKGKDISISFVNSVHVPEGYAIKIMPHEQLIKHKSLATASVVVNNDTDNQSISVKLVMRFNAETLLTTIRPLMRLELNRK